jgi:hypothetical protein
MHISFEKFLVYYEDVTWYARGRVILDWTRCPQYSWSQIIKTVDSTDTDRFKFSAI